MKPERIAELRDLASKTNRFDFTDFDSPERPRHWIGEVLSELLDALESAQAELAAIRGGKIWILEPRESDFDAFSEDPSFASEEGSWSTSHDSAARIGIAWARDHAVAAVPEGKVLVDAGELEALRATIAKLKEFHDPVNVAKRIEEYAAQHKPAQREVVPNRTGGWFMEGDQGQRTTTAASASQRRGQGGKGAEDA
jgi:hypothetical protein